jgi:putative hydrolase of the HAD superfamily
VFDLDHTLFDPNTLPRALFSEVEARVRQAAAGHLSNTLLEAALADACRLPFDRVVAQHRLPGVVSAAWREAASAVEVTTPLVPYGDVVAALEQLPLRRFLLTTGFRRLQESKLRQLGLTPLFAAVYIDALDAPDPSGKAALLKQLLVEQELRASEVVVFGDRADDELAAARALGMVAVQVLRPGVIASSEASCRVSTFDELPALLTRLGGAGVA